MSIDDRVALWDAINAFVAASGGDTGNTSSARRDAVVLVDRIVDRMTHQRGWVCIRHRCAAHYDVPAQNATESSGSECGGCIAAQRDEARRTADDNAYRAGTAMAERDEAIGLLRRWWAATGAEEDAAVAGAICDYLGRRFGAELDAAAIRSERRTGDEDG